MKRHSHSGFLKGATLFNFLCVMLFLWGCADKKEQKEIRIGLVSGLSGNAGLYGMGITGGVRLAVEEINSLGGIRGVPIRLIIADDSSDYRHTLAVTEEMIIRDNVLAIIGESMSNRTTALLTVADRYKIPVISPAATATDLAEKSPYAVRFSFSDRAQAEVLADHVRRHARRLYNDKPASILIFKNILSDYSVSLTEHFRSELAGKGGNIIAEISIEEDSLLSPKAISLLRKMTPDMVFLPLYSQDILFLLPQIKLLFPKAVILSADGLDVQRTLQDNALLLDGVVFTTHHAVMDSTPELRTFAERYRLYNRVAADPFSLVGYDATRFLFSIIEQVMKTNPSPTPEALAESLSRATLYEGISAKHIFLNRGNQRMPTLVRFRNGEIQVMN